MSLAGGPLTLSRLRTQPWLQPQDRPAVITSTKGGIIPVDKGKVEDKEKILRRGETIHKRLEREIHPVEIKVSWVTEEDKWGLRCGQTFGYADSSLLNMLAGMEALLTLNKCRELPVVGFVDDILVFGIIVGWRARQSADSRMRSRASRWRRRPQRPRHGQRGLPPAVSQL